VAASAERLNQLAADLQASVRRFQL